MWDWIKRFFLAEPPPPPALPDVADSPKVAELPELAEDAELAEEVPVKPYSILVNSNPTAKIGKVIRKS